MKIITFDGAASEMAKLNKKWTLAISAYSLDERHPDPDEFARAAPCLSHDTRALLDRCGLVICKSKKECLDLFNEAVGVRGSKIKGRTRASVMMIDPSGQFYDEK